MKKVLLLVRGLALFAAIGGLLQLAFVEIFVDLPVSWKLYAAVVVLCAGALAQRGLPLRARVVRIVVLLLVSSLSATLYFVDWSSRKVFLRHLDRIKVGMTEPEVRRIMAGYIEGTGWPAAPPVESPVKPNDASAGPPALDTGHARYPIAASPTGEMMIKDSMVFRHSEVWYYNSDFGIVTFRAGRVSAVSFSRD